LEMNVYFVRHGQSEANAARTYSGWSHVPLTEKGIADAAHAGQLLKGIEFAIVMPTDENGLSVAGDLGTVILPNTAAV